MTNCTLQFWLLALAGWLNREQQDVIEHLREENRVYREMLGDRRPRFNDEQWRRLASKAKALARRTPAALEGIVTPDTLLRWYRELIASKYNGGWRRGRPQTRATLADELLRVARENPTWGYTRIRGALANLGHQVGRSTVRRLLLENGLQPAPRRTAWATFLRSHWEQLAATDMFTVEVVMPRGLVWYVVLFIIELSTRRVPFAGVAVDPGESWVKQVLRNQLDVQDGFLVGKR